MKVDRGFCNQPDRDVPKIRCGYPLPCPYHTFRIEEGNRTIGVPSDAKVNQIMINRLREIQKVIFKKKEKK